MFLLGLGRRASLLVLLCLLAGGSAGCFLRKPGQVDERKDPWYLEGRERVSSMDWEGAVGAFQKALENNPKSAAAHKELGLLYERHMRDYAAAIYHYQRLLELNPQDEHADAMQGMITHCKQQLASEVGPIPVDEITQRILEQKEKLDKENKKLKADLEESKKALAVAQEDINTLRRQLQLAPQTGNTGGSATTTTHTPSPMPTRNTGGTATPSNTGTTTTGGSRTHTIQSGDTLFGIGQRYGFTEAQMKAANPGVDARSLKLGQKINLPAR